MSKNQEKLTIRLREIRQLIVGLSSEEYTFSQEDVKLMAISHLLMIYRVMARKAFTAGVDMLDAAKASSELSDILMKLTREVLGVEISTDMIKDLSTISKKLQEDNLKEE